MKTLCTFALIGCALSQSLLAGDWPQWRGPNRDGHAASARPEINTLPKDPKALWRLEIGPGHSAPVLAGKTLIYLDELEGKEVAHAVDIATGKERWRQAYAEPALYSGFGQGPRCAPLIDGDRVYVQSGRGEFRCLSMKDGKTLWRVNFETDYGATWFGNKSENAESKETAARRHGNNGAPVIDGNRIFVAVGSPQGATLVAFDKLTGKELWKAGTDNAAYSSLMVGTLGGVRQVVDFTADALMGVEVEKGNILWRFPIKTGAKRHTVTPILVGDTVTVSSHSVGMLQYKISKAGNGVKAEQAWLADSVKTMLTTPVLVEGKLYGLGTTTGKNSEFVCVDYATGKKLWAKPGFEDYASVIAVGKNIMVLNSTGELILLKADSTAYTELARMQACGKTWSFPAYAEGRLYVRDGRQLAALQLSAEVVP